MIIFNNINLQKVQGVGKGKSKYYIQNGQYFAEEAAILHYRSKGYNAIWSENDYWSTIMSLLFWDVIFAKTKGAVIASIGGFTTELHPDDPDFDNYFNQMISLNGMPHDFFKPEFYNRRKNLINNRIQELKNVDIGQKLFESYKRNYGKNCRPIENWNKYKIEELLIPFQIVEKEKILNILERLISNFNDNRSGLPDLIVYNNKNFFFSEVKSENDSISEKQKDWHDFLSTANNFKVELLLINNSEIQIKRLKSKYSPKSLEAIISFGYSSSKKLEEAKRFIQQQDTFSTQGKGKDQIFKAKFKINEKEIDKLYKILDLTSGWKTQKIELIGEIIKSTDLRNALWCFRKKGEQKESIDYCKIKSNNQLNMFNCKNINFNALENDIWQDYGYIDTTRGEWIFNHNKINEETERIIERLKYCPLFDPKKIKNHIKKMPVKINPIIDNKWAFITNDHDIWFWHNNKWLSTRSNTRFPGFNVVIGVKKLSADEKNITLRYLKEEEKMYRSFERSDPVKTAHKPKAFRVKKKKGCFIATAIYGSENVYQVKVLRLFRDDFLENRIFGTFFINLYYEISPRILQHLHEHYFIFNLAKRNLDIIVKIIENFKNI